MEFSIEHKLVQTFALKVGRIDDRTWSSHKKLTGWVELKPSWTRVHENVLEI